MNTLDFAKYIDDLIKLRDMLKDVESHVKNMHSITEEEVEKIYNMAPRTFNNILEVTKEIDELCEELF